jgi:preprotein translocase subunit SecG
VHGISEKEKAKIRPSLSLIALLSFVASFSIARTFTILTSFGVFVRGIHIHHFWFGVALLAIGGWLGIIYEGERITRIAAILFGAGGGLFGDEAGLLLTFGNYWTNITYTLVIVFLAIALMMILVARYWQSIRDDFTEFLRSDAGLYSGVFLIAVSIAFIIGTRNPFITLGFSICAAVGFVTIVACFAQRFLMRKQKKKE